MKLEKKLLIIGAISLITTLLLYFIDSDPSYPGISGAIMTIFELLMMTGLIFIIIAINFFAISFFVRKLAWVFSKK